MFQDYEEDWHRFKLYIENKAKDRCFISRKNWFKLQEFHLEKFLRETQYPFGFLIRVKVMYPEQYHTIKGMPRMFNFYREKRDRFLRKKEE